VDLETVWVTQNKSMFLDTLASLVVGYTCEHHCALLRKKFHVMGPWLCLVNWLPHVAKPEMLKLRPVFASRRRCGMPDMFRLSNFFFVLGYCSIFVFI
jgi:hypothetical protein